MLELALAFSLFLGLHIVPSRPAVRATLVRLTGERAFLALYTAVSLLALAWVSVAAARAPVIILWPALPELKLITAALMPIALWLLVCGLMHPPLCSLRLSPAPTSSHHVAVITRQPIFWAFGVWAFAHIPPNGALVPVLIFALLGAFALLGGLRFDSRRLMALDPAERREADRITSFLPFGALFSETGRWLWPWRDFAISVLLTLGLYLAVVLAHPVLFGAYPLAGLW